MKNLVVIPVMLVLVCCTIPQKNKLIFKSDLQVSNILNFEITPESAFDKSGLMFSDQGAWFANGIPEEANEATIKIIDGDEGLLDRGISFRENYHPITGKGLNA
jgi:hypothetical protein